MIKFTNKKDRRYGAALWAGFLGGNVSSLVKFGAEIPLPPRTPDRASIQPMLLVVRLTSHPFSLLGVRQYTLRLDRPVRPLDH